jgi:hypothetical protein
LASLLESEEREPSFRSSSERTFAREHIGSKMN